MNKNTEKLLIALSGGVDSAVTALLCQQMGYELVAATLVTYEDVDGSLNDAKELCTKLNIPHYTLDVRKDFEKEVIVPFIQGYLKGYTPNPCVICNPHLKFKKILEFADELGIDKIATGHYAKVQFNEDSNRYEILCAKDEGKDQSYMLYGLSQDQLKRVVFPLGDLIKSEVREIGEKAGLGVANKKDSQDICFLPKGDYPQFIKNKCSDHFCCQPGMFITSDGKVLGQHKGIVNYTIGQRKHLGIPLDPSLYVLDKNPETNRVVLGPEKELYLKEFIVKDLNLLSLAAIEKGMEFEAKIRYSKNFAKVLVKEVLDENTIYCTFETAQRAISPGQAAVFYLEGKVMAGGIIERAVK